MEVAFVLIAAKEALQRHKVHLPALCVLQGLSPQRPLKLHVSHVLQDLTLR